MCALLEELMNLFLKGQLLSKCSEEPQCKMILMEQITITKKTKTTLLIIILK